MSALAEILQRVPEELLRAEIRRRYSFHQRTAESVHLAACEWLGICPETTQHSVRNRLRMRIIYMMATTYKIELPAIYGFYGVNHGTVHNAIRVTEIKLAEDPEFAAEYNAMNESLKGADILRNSQ